MQEILANSQLQIYFENIINNKISQEEIITIADIRLPAVELNDDSYFELRSAR